MHAGPGVPFLQPRSFVEGVDPRLGDAVRDHQEDGADPEPGADTDDRAVSLLAQDGQGRLDAVDLAAQVHVEDPVDRLDGERVELPVTGDGGVVDPDIDPAEALSSRLREVLHLRPHRAVGGTTAAPWAAKCLAVSRPMPDDAPVIATTRCLVAPTAGLRCSGGMGGGGPEPVAR